MIEDAATLSLLEKAIGVTTAAVTLITTIIAAFDLLHARARSSTPSASNLIQRSNLSQLDKDAITSQIQTMRKKLILLTLTVVIMSVLFFILLTASDKSRLYKLVEKHDGNTFSNSTTETPQIARALTDREALTRETDLRATVRNSKKTFDIFAVRGAVVEAFEEEFRAAALRGVNIRVIFLDHGPENIQNVDAYISQLGPSKHDRNWYFDGAKHSIEVVRRLQSDITRSNSPSKGRIELRLLKAPFYNSIWIRDAEDKENSVAHIAVTYYGEEPKYPSLRFGSLSPKIVESIRQQFETIWSQAHVSKP